MTAGPPGAVRRDSLDDVRASGSFAAAFAADAAETNRRRLRVLLPVMTALHVLHVIHFRVPEGAAAAMTAAALRWRHALVAMHATMVPIALLLTLFVWRARRPALVRLTGPLAATVYLVHGAICTGLDQLVVANVTAYVGYCFGIAVVIYLGVREIALVYGLGAVALIASVSAVQHSSDARAATIPNCVTLTFMSACVAALVYAARRRDVEQRRTIERQGSELARLNADLELRVRDQVSEIVARATEVERLNAQLQAQVRERSTELSLALARIGRSRDDDGTLREGSLLGDRFTIGRCIGEGGMGAVYAGVDRTSGARVAIKVIQATSARHLDAMHRFLREAGSTAKVTHPAVVKMLHVDVSDDGLLFQAQELVDGEALSRFLRTPWTPGAAARLMALLFDALATAHAQGVVHRDVKPENLMLTHASPGLKLLDFGIAKLYDAVSAGGPGTSVGTVLGTPAYMAPEQIEACDGITDRADVYACGVLLFRLLCARLPFEASRATEMFSRHLLDAAPDVRSLRPAIPEEIALVVAACLEKAPAARPSAAELAARLAVIADALGAGPVESLRASASLSLEPTMTSTRV